MSNSRLASVKRSDGSGMRSDGTKWGCRPLGELVEIFDGPHATPTKTDAGPIFLGIECLDGGRLDLSKAAHLSEEDFGRWTRRVTPRPDDVVFSYETRLGQAALMPNGLRCCLGRRMGLLRTRDDRIVPRFLLYAYLGPQFQRVIVENTISGSTVDRIPLKSMGGFEIVLPPREEQERIARVLGALDDKIESNRRLSTLLEDAAAAVFDARFVDFVGVEEFEDSEFGPIPVGWRVGRLSDYCEFRYGYTASASDEPLGPRFLRVKDINKQPWIDWDSVPFCEIEDAAIERFRLLPGDLVVARMADPGKTAQVVDEVEAVCASYLVRIRPSAPEWSDFLHRYMRSPPYQSYIASMMSGSVQKNINARVLTAAEMVSPPFAAIEQFGSTVGPMHKLQASYIREASALQAARDALLPKLISGQLRVPVSDDADEVIGSLVEAAL